MARESPPPQFSFKFFVEPAHTSKNGMILNYDVPQGSVRREEKLEKLCVACLPGPSSLIWYMRPPRALLWCCCDHSQQGIELHIISIIVGKYVGQPHKGEVVRTLTCGCVPPRAQIKRKNTVLRGGTMWIKRRSDRLLINCSAYLLYTPSAYLPRGKHASS